MTNTAPEANLDRRHASAMRVALESELLVRGGWINGAAVESGQGFAVHDPATGALLTEVSDLGVDAAQAAINAANAALTAWRTTPIEQRSEAVSRWAQLIEDHADALGMIVTMESGKPLTQAQGEARQCAALLLYFVEQAGRLGNPIAAAGTAAQRNYSFRQPVGVVACITPWNFPAAAVIVKAGAAIITGCTSIVKPSEETPLIALALAKLASAAGIPDGVINVVPCKDPRAVGGALCSSKYVRMLSFTGSISTGQQLYAACGATVKRLALELGGNAPFIVFDDADLDRALDGAMAARFYNSGQICVGANRYYVHGHIYDHFAAQLADRVAALRVGAGSDPDTELGPMINRAAVNRLNALVDSAAAKGARVLAGGRQQHADSRFFQPTVLGDMRPSMPAHDAEIFGPIACLYRFDDESAVLQQANATEAGLSAYLYTGDKRRQEYFINELEAGVIGVNTPSIFANDLPFGGIKQSGLGREHGPDCLDEFLETKSVCQAAL